MIALVCALLSGGMFYSAYGRDDAWMLAWLAPAPLLWLAYGDAPRGDAPRWQVVATSLFASAMGTVYFFQAYGTFLPAYATAIMIGNGLLLGVSLLLVPTLCKLAPVTALFMFPTAWTSVEFLEGWISPHGAADTTAKGSFTDSPRFPTTVVESWRSRGSDDRESIGLSALVFRVGVRAPSAGAQGGDRA